MSSVYFTKVVQNSVLLIFWSLRLTALRLDPDSGVSRASYSTIDLFVALETATSNTCVSVTHHEDEFDHKS